VPNGVSVAHFAGARPLPGRNPADTVVFLGRIDEDRKGLAVLLDALPALVAAVPAVRLLVAGPGNIEQVRALIPAPLQSRVELLGLVSEADKAGVYASGAVYCAPNTHGESFGVVLIEAMAAGTPVVASDLEAFRRVLQDGRAGVLFPVGDSAALAGELAALLRDAPRRIELAARGRQAVAPYDWAQVSRQVVEVYETVAAAAPVELEDTTDEPDVVDLGQDDDPGRVSETLRRWLAVVRERVAP